MVDLLQMKTWSVALVLCLNIGVDPPDVVKTTPCARKECWIGEPLGPVLPPSPPPPHTHTHSTQSCTYTWAHLCYLGLTNTHLTDSLSTSPQKALEEIGNNLQKQYERWQPRARYKQLLDPTTEEARKLCMALRKNAKVSINLNCFVLFSVFLFYVCLLFYFEDIIMCWEKY